MYTCTFSLINTLACRGISTQTQIHYTQVYMYSVQCTCMYYSCLSAVDNGLVYKVIIAGESDGVRRPLIVDQITVSQQLNTVYYYISRLIAGYIKFPCMVNDYSWQLGDMSSVREIRMEVRAYMLLLIRIYYKALYIYLYIFILYYIISIYY